MDKAMNGPGTSRGGHGGPIAATDRVASVIARDERLIDVFTSLSPAFERLRNPAMRKVMSRLVTVEQAARMARVDPEELVSRLNAAVGAVESGVGEGAAGADPGAGDGGAAVVAGTAGVVRTAGTEGTAGAAGAAGTAAPHTEFAPGDSPPPVLARIPEDRIVDLDVRDDLRQGREPFSKIMAARRTIPEGGVLRVRAIFEPVPLYAVMAKQGFAHWTERFADDDWRVWFYPVGMMEDEEAAGPRGAPGTLPQAVPATPPEEGPPTSPAAAPDPASPADAGGDTVIVLDVRGLEPPEPMMRTLETLETLPPRATLVQINSRVPQFLLPLLDARGYTAEVREETPGVVRVFIRRKADA